MHNYKILNTQNIAIWVDRSKYMHSVIINRIMFQRLYIIGFASEGTMVRSVPIAARLLHLWPKVP